MKTCTNCNTENKDSSNFCRKCGFILPGFKKKDVNVDIALIEKVNELQKKVTSSENEIKKLKSKEDLFTTNITTLQSKLTESQEQLSNAYKAYNSERLKVTEAEKKADAAIKELQEANNSSSSTFFIIAIITLIVISISLYIDNNKKIEANKTLYHKVSNLESTNSKLTKENKSMSSIISKIGKNNPLFTGNIYIKNGTENYGAKIYSRNTTYLYPKVEIFSLIEGNVDINVKLIAPYGLSVGKSSPKGYSYKDSFYLQKNTTTSCEFAGWGSSIEGNWSPGTYKYEFYYKGKCIGSKSFKIY